MHRLAAWPVRLLLAAVGCVPGSQPAFDGDPLFGGQPRCRATAPSPSSIRLRM